MTLDQSPRYFEFDYNFGSIWFCKALFILICIRTLITVMRRTEPKLKVKKRPNSDQTHGYILLIDRAGTIIKFNRIKFIMYHIMYCYKKYILLILYIPKS